MSMPKRVFILRGPSGSGKDHWIKQQSLGHAVVCSADQYFMRLVPDVEAPGGQRHEYKFDVKKLTLAHNQCMEDFLVSLGDQTVDTVIVNNTNTEYWEFKNYIHAAALVKAQITLVEFECETREHVVACAQRNAHGVPLASVAAMWARFQASEIPGVEVIKVPFQAKEESNEGE
jgi:predicted kinase